MKEIQQENYYNSINEKYIDNHLSIKACLESFVSDLLFQGDTTRVIFSQPDILFRQRIEYLDKGKQGPEYEAINLNLPFANYYQSSDFEDDDRIASIQAKQAVVGEYSYALGRRLRSLPVKATFKIQAFFDRRDDVRVAFQLFHWEKTPKYPVQYYDVRYYRGKSIGIPVLFTIENITTNPEWQETEFLKNQRIFPIEVTLTVRTYQVLINNINGFIDLPIKIDKRYRESDEAVVLTNETLLLWCIDKFGLDMTPTKTDTKEDDSLIDYGKLYFQTEDPTPEQLEWLGGKLYNNQTLDIINAYYQEEDRNFLESYYQDVESTTTNSATIKYVLSEQDKNAIVSIEILVPSRDKIIIKDLEQDSIVIDNLTQNSEYNLKIIVNTLNGTKKLYNLTIKTLPEENYNNEKNPDEIILKPAIKKLSALIGKNI